VPSEPPRILVVEDDPTWRDLIGAALVAFGFDVTATDSVLSATQVIPQVRPSAILLDIALPFRSGAAWLAALKADARTADIPVVVVSALPEMLSAERRALAAAVVPKPFEPRVLARVVREACERTAAQARLSE
jgi:CheY-like chemotaxis protein